MGFPHCCCIPKKDGKIQIYDDYKVTVNQVLDVEQNSLPKLDDLFATLAERKKFTKLVKISPKPFSNSYWMMTQRSW